MLYWPIHVSLKGLCNTICLPTNHAPMKTNNWLWLLCCVLLAPPLHAQPFEPFTVPSGAELNFALPDLQGDSRTLGDYRGKVVLINFWASWCTPCLREMPDLMQLKKHYAAWPFEIITINVGESPAHARQFADSLKFDLPVLLDQQRSVFKRWGGKVMPMSLLFDLRGDVRYRAIGDPGWFDLPTQNIIDDLLKAAKPG